jgi:uncharacterized protein involved in response to NO
MSCACAQSGDGVTPRFRLTWNGDPYRLLFPAGIVLGVYGLLLWPAFVYKLLPVYPGILHARIMIEGFLLSFVIGFLGTAMPHMLEVPAWSRSVTRGFAVVIFGISGLHMAGAHVLGDLAFAATLLVLAVLLARRFPMRKDLPPPGFCLVAGGLACGFVGALLMALGKGLFTYQLGKGLLYQGFLLLPILGIGSYLLPRMLGLENRQLLPGSRTPTPLWKRRAAEHAGVGGLIVVSFVIEAAGQFQWACAVRATAFAGGFLLQVPLWRMGRLRGSIARWLPVPFVSIPLGYLAMALFPNQRMDLLHLVLISGYALLVVLVASRVALGHGGAHDRLYLRWRSLNWIGGLTLLAMLTRISAPWLRKGPWSHYAYAAITLSVVLLLWLIRFIPFLCTPTSEEPA